MAAHGSSANVSDSTVSDMITELRSDWAVERITRHRYATDFVASVEVQTSGSQRTVVLKATTSELSDPATVRVEPRMLDLVARETSIPVPAVLGYRDQHDAYPAPFYLMEHVPGQNLSRRLEDVSLTTQRTVCDQLGSYLAQLHDLDRPSHYGDVGVQNGEICVLDTEDCRQYTDFRTHLRSLSERYLSELADGGPFAELADDPYRFTDLVPRIRSFLEASLPSLPEPDPPSLCHNDYRYGNVLVGAESGDVTAIIDWADVISADPVYNVAKSEMYIFTRQTRDERRIDELRRRFRNSYSDARTGWVLDDEARERLSVYRVVCRVQAMLFFPLWYQRAPTTVRDDKATAHREFVERHVD